MAGSQNPLLAGTGCLASNRSSARLASVPGGTTTFSDDDFDCMKYHCSAAHDQPRGCGQPLRTKAKGQSQSPEKTIISGPW
jgi:hypothetical protein